MTRNSKKNEKLNIENHYFIINIKSFPNRRNKIIKKVLKNIA